MHVDLITTTNKGAAKIIHGTENGKKTACGINLTKPENIGHYANTGEMSDVIQLTCEKCKTVIAKKLIKESNKEMAAQLKEEQRQLKRERAAAKHHHEAAAPAAPAERPAETSSSGYVPPSMRKAQQAQSRPIEAPVPAVPKPAAQTAPSPVPSNISSGVDDALAQFAIPQVPTSVPSMPAPAPAPAPKEDVLSQFAIPQVPTSVPSMPAPSPAPAPAPQDDILSQFAIPQVPTSVPSMPAPSPAPAPAQQEDVLSQFAIPTVPTSVPSMPTPAPAPVPQDDVLAQFAIPTVPTSIPTMPSRSPAPSPVSAPQDDVMSQFDIPAVPNAIPVSTAKNDPAAAADDLLAQFSIPNPTISQVQSAPELKVPDVLPSVGSGAVKQNDILAQFSDRPDVAPVADFADLPRVEAEIDENLSSQTPAFSESDEIVEVTPVPAPNDYDPFEKPKTELEKDVSDFLDDLLLMPGATSAPKPEAPAPASAPAPAPVQNPLPDLVTVPTSAPATPKSAGFHETEVPTLDIPAAPPAQTVPQIPVPPLPQMSYPQAGTQVQQSAQPNLFSVPARAKQTEPDTPTPLFVGYSADGRQIFQNFDALGNPIPINEPVYSAPPEQPKNAPLISNAVNAATQGIGAPIMDMDELMAKMGIETPAQKAENEGKAINYMEYKIPAKKKKKPASKPASAQKTEPEGPISAAEAKRRKKVDKINKEFEKQLRARGIDPKTGGIIIDK